MAKSCKINEAGYIHELTKSANVKGIMEVATRCGELLVVFVRLSGCRPCESTKPEWAKFAVACEARHIHTVMVEHSVFGDNDPRGPRDKSFPYIFKVYRGAIVEFDSSWARTDANFRRFIGI
jgi:hypothetical protein